MEHISKLSKTEKYQKERIIQLTELWALHTYMGMTRVHKNQSLCNSLSFENWNFQNE